MPVKDTKNPPSRKLTAPVTSEIYKEEKPSPFSIEGIRSGAVQSKIFKGFIVLSGVVMAGGFIMSSLNTSGVPTGNPGAPSAAPVALVGSQSISGVQLAGAFEQSRRFGESYGQKIGVTDYLRSKYQTLQALTDNAANLEAAKNAGISISEAEIEAEIDKQIKDSFKPQAGQSEAAFRRKVEAEFGSLEEAPAKMKERITSEVRESVSNKLLLEKLQKQVKDENKVSEDDYKRSVTKLKLWQIVLRPKISAVSDKAATDKNNAEVAARVAKIFAALKTSPTLENFQKIAKTSSEDLATKTKGGDFGFKSPAELTYGIDISDVLAKSSTDLVGPLSDLGGNQYLFFIESRKTELPKDYAKNKKKLLADFETQQDNNAWTKKEGEFKKAQVPDISDPALAAYQIQSTDVLSATGDEQKRLREDAIARYTSALSSASSTEAAAINYQLAHLYRDQNDRVKQQESLAAAVKNVGSDANLRLEYGRMLSDGAKPKESLEQLKAAATAVDASPSGPSMFGTNPDDALRQQIAIEFDKLKEPKLAAAQRAKIKPAAPAAGGMMGGMNGLPPGVSIKPGR